MTDKTKGKPIKLTPAQLRVLRELSEPGAYARKVYAHTGIVWSLAYRRYTPTINALTKMGLVRYYLAENNMQNTSAKIISDAGRAYLAEMDGQQ